MTGPQRLDKGHDADVGRSDWSLLMGRAQQGDREAYRQLLTEITPYLRSIARRMSVPPAEVEDAVQDVLLTVHVIRHTYHPERPFGPWLATVARRRIIDGLRRRWRRTALETGTEPRAETFAAAETNWQEPASDGDQLRRAIERLPAGQQRAIILLKLRELSLKDAARESGMSIASLKVAAHRGLKALRRLLRHEDDS
jgi:RNA polymerase sigma-70 factor (ECF subfamily)